MAEYDMDDLGAAATLKARYGPSLGDTYAVAAAKEEDDGHDVTLLVGADGDYDVFEEAERFSHPIERFRDDHA